MGESQKSIIVIGSGPIRIGQGIEFDYCTVHCVWAIQEAGYKAIVINNNPETVSTDFDTSDTLYFDPLTIEDVLNIIEQENAEGVMVQFGGQTAINLAAQLHAAGIKIFGTPSSAIDDAEDRDLFEKILSELNVPKPPGRAVISSEQAVVVASEIGYPVLVRPSFVLGGRAMEIIYDEEELQHYMRYVGEVSPKAPILVDKYVTGGESEVDVICDGEVCLLPGIMEHIERAGVHSGDSRAVYPPQTMSQNLQNQIVDIATRMSLRLGIRGIMNIQFVTADDTAYVLEANPRASRTVPYLSKITGVPMVKLATQAALGVKLRDCGYEGGLVKTTPLIAVKAPVFSFLKLTKVDPILGPEMKSTGEIMGIDTDFGRALYKAMVAAGINCPSKGSVLVTVADSDKEEALEIVQGFVKRGFKIYATGGTWTYLADHGVEATRVAKLHEGSPNPVELIESKQVDLLINTLTRNRQIELEARQIRRASIEMGIPCLTSLDTARALLTGLEAFDSDQEIGVHTVEEYVKGV